VAESTRTAAAPPTAASSQRKPLLLPFVQLEFAGLVGLPDGRYLARDGELERVLIVQTLGAPRPTRKRRKVRDADPSDPQLPLTRLTVAGGESFDDARSAARWLEATARDKAARAAAIRNAMRLVNRGLGALRAEARDPLVQDLGATRALAVRIGFGDGEELAEGRWQEAREIPPPRRGRLDDIDPQSRVASVLAGRDEVHPAETMLERARLDIEQGRDHEARLGLAAARDALREAPGPDDAKIRTRIEDAERKLGV
jgi:hypothetical protein